MWVGTRFVAANESAAPNRHKEGLTAAAATDTVRTLIYSGRPVRTLMTDYVRSWEDHRQVRDGRRASFAHSVLVDGVLLLGEHIHIVWIILRRRVCAVRTHLYIHEEISIDR